MKKVSEIKPCTHLAGEFFVAAELSKRGLNVALTMGNAKKVDLIVEHEGRTIPIQVKAIAKKQNVGFPLNLEMNYSGKVVFVCVVLNGISEQPTYYVLSGKDVQRKRADYKTRSILDVGKIKEYKDNWSLITGLIK